VAVRFLLDENLSEQLVRSWKNADAIEAFVAHPELGVLALGLGPRSR
jgi:hypothetical protein